MIIEELIEELDKLIEKAWHVPLTGGKCLIDSIDLEKILDDIRLNLPHEIKKAQEIIDKEHKIIDGARSASETIIEKAEERAKTIIDEQEIVRLSRQKSRDILISSQQKEKEIKQGAYEYVENMMASIENSLKKCLGDVKDIKATVHGQKVNERKTTI